MDVRKYATLAAVVDETLAGRTENARMLLSDLVDRQLNAGAGSEDLQYYIFASALSRRLASEKSAEINLYLRQFQTPQISLFNLLARHLPTVRMAGPLANEVLAGFVGAHDEVTLLDVGIGSGRQEVGLLYLLAMQRRLPRKLNVIAIEPDAGSLRQAGASLADAARTLGMELHFHPVHKVVEELDDADWRFFASFAAPMVVLGAFAVHHVRSSARGNARDVLFRRLRALEPDAVVLCEPSSNHDSPCLRERFAAAWHHFGLTFRIIDGLQIGGAEKSAMKMFFAREIEDILANAEEARCERHEPVDAWVRRLREAGFSPCTDFGLVGAPSSGPVRVAARDGYLGLDYGDETLVAIVCATSAAPARAGRISPRLLQQVA
ncbi:MAG: GRAS family protein [Gemmatimonadetes bacterium]|nr:GRAS family protein [Gemmatimonadota bacterium]